MTSQLKDENTIQIPTSLKKFPFPNPILLQYSGTRGFCILEGILKLQAKVINNNKVQNSIAQNNQSSDKQTGKQIKAIKEKTPDYCMAASAVPSTAGSGCECADHR